MTKINRITKVGLVKGRHDLPVDDYILDVVNDVMDFTSIDDMVFDKLKGLTNPDVYTGVGINSYAYTDDLIWSSDVHLMVYVTGLTAVTAAVIKFCAMKGVKLTLMHFDAIAGDYKPQVIF